MEACHGHDEHRAGTTQTAVLTSYELRGLRRSLEVGLLLQVRCVAEAVATAVQSTRLLCQGLGARGSPVCALSRWTSRSSQA